MPHARDLLRSMSEFKIRRFERLLAESPDDEQWDPLVELTEGERENLKRLASEAVLGEEELSGRLRYSG